MPISFVAAGAVATGTNPVVAVPAGYQQADLLVLTVSVAAAVAPTTPGGWTLLGSTTTTPRIYVYTKFTGGTESSVTVTVASTTTKAVMCAYRGVSNTDTISTFAAATSTTIATNTLTTTYANEYVISIYAMTTGADTWTAPGSTTTRVDSAGTAAVAGLLIVDELQAAAGLSTARTATSSASKALCAGSFSIISNDRYWRGGTGTWNTTSTTNWSFSSGGAGGAPVPISRDNVFFDQAGTYTVTMTGALNCLDITVSAGTVTFATGTSPTLNVAGSMSLRAGTVWNLSGAITFSSTTTGRTITTNGTALAGVFGTNSIFFNGIGGSWTLGSALTLSNGHLNVLAGTFNTGGYNLTIPLELRSNTTTNVRAINLSSSTVTLGSGISGGEPIALAATNLTFNAGTSQINIGNTTTLFSGSGLTFYNVAFTGVNFGGFTSTINGSNTYNNLSFTGISAASRGIGTYVFSATQTINGTLSTTSTAGNRRILLRSATYGISYDFVINAPPSITDVDFLGIYVRGTAAPISGTRIGNRGECRGITFDTPKTVYWNLAGAQNWSANGWATTSTGAPSTDNFPLPQDTATFTNAGSVTGTITLDGAIPYTGTVDMSGRTSAMTLATSNATTVYGNWTNGSGTAFTGIVALTFSGGGTQTITSAGKTFTCPIAIDTYGGTVQLADALNIGSRTLTVTNGTFNTQGYNLSVGSFSSNNSNVRTISFGASTITLASGGSVWTIASTNLTFNAGTSTITGAGGAVTFAGGDVTYYNVNLSASSTVNSSNTFNNLTFTAPGIVGINIVSFSANQTINGTLTCAGASAVQRIFLRSNTIGTQRTLTVNSISATDCDFRDINLAGTASGASPTRAGNCGGNSGITFSSKTVYWNLAGAQNWSATGWCPSSGGTPDINQFPLAQDTAVFDDTGSAGTVTIEAVWNVGTINFGSRTSAMTFQVTTSPSGVYGSLTNGTGVTWGTNLGLDFRNRSSSTITSNGAAIAGSLRIDCLTGTVSLTDALSGSANSLTVNSGTFDAVTYNVTRLSFTATSGTTKMGTGTWTLAGTGTVWTGAGTIIVGTSTIVLSDTSTAARTFDGGSLYYNKLTIGGTTGTSTLTINGFNIFGELASTKTVAHTIAFGTTTQTFGKWSVTGTVGNVVTITGTSTSNVISGPAVTGVDYLAMGSWGVSTTSPGEFYAGANSTGTAAAPVFRTAAPAPRTLYWVGGTGNWSSTTKWSTSSGGGSGAAIPTSLDAVVFDSASNATAYTATIDAGVTLARCASFTMAGPLSGNVTFAGSVGIAFHGSVSLSTTGISWTYSGAIQLAGNGSYTYTQNGNFASNAWTVVGINSTWTLGSAISVGISNLSVTYGTFSTSASNYAVTCSSFNSQGLGVRSISLNGSTISTIGAGVSLVSVNLTFTAGTSLFSISGSPALSAGGITFYGVSIINTTVTSIQISGEITFTNLSFSGRTLVGVTLVTFSGNQTITGTLTLSGGTASAYRVFLCSNTPTVQRTLTVNALAAGAADFDFRDIAIAGAAAPISGTRFGDCKGNSGITFPAAKTVYYGAGANTNFGASGAGSWSATSGGALDATQFPLAQDTAVFPAAIPPSGFATINANYNLGTIDMSLRTVNGMTLATSTNTPNIHGNWITGTQSNISSSVNGQLNFSGRGSQTITSAGQTFPQTINIDSPGGSVTLQDAFVGSNTNNTLILASGTFNAASYNVSLYRFSSFSSNTRTLGIGSGTWSVSDPTASVWTMSSSSGLTVTGTGTISLTANSGVGKTFSGGDANYSGITLNQGGSVTLTITGNNTFKDITNTYSATGATTIALGSTTQTVTQFTGTGTSGKVLTISGSTGTLIMSGAAKATTSDYLTISNVRAYSVFDTWYAGINSTNSGSLGWYFRSQTNQLYSSGIRETAQISEAIPAPPVPIRSSIQDTVRGSDSIASTATFFSAFQDTVRSSDSIAATIYVPIIDSNISESARQSDSVTAALTLSGAFQDTVQGLDQISATPVYLGQISELGRGDDSISVTATFTGNLSDSAQGSDQVATSAVMLSSVQDTIQGADTFSNTASFVSQVSDFTRGADTFSGIASFVSQVSDSARGADSFATSFDVNSYVSEQTQVLDIASVLAVFASSIQESGQGDDAASAAAIFVSNVSDSSQTDDQFAVSAVLLSAIQDSAQGSDAVSGAATFASQTSDSAQALDSLTTSFNVNSAVSEQGQGSDLTAALVVFASSVQESGRGNDAISATATFVSNASESVRGNDQTAASALFNSSVSLTAQAADSQIGFITFPTSVVDTAQGSDLFNSSFTANAALSDAAQGSDSLNALAVFRSSLADTARASETFNTSAIFNSSFLDLTRISDSARSSAVFSGNFVDTVQGSDQDVGFIRFPASLSETAQISDTNSARFTARGVISESVRASDSLNTVVSFKANVADQVRAFETISTKAVFNSATNNQVRIADTNVGFIRFPASISDTAQISDATAAKATFIPFVSETVRGSDAVSTVFTVRGNVSETARAADTTIVAPSVFNAPFIDTVRIADTASALAVFPTAFADSAQMSDLNIAKMIYSRATADTAQVSDLTAAFRTSFPVFSDTVRGSDALATKVTLQSSLSELARVSDVDSSLPIYSTNIIDTVRTAETVAAKQTFKTDINETGRIEPIVYSYPIYRTNIAEQSQGSDTVSSLRVLPGSITETARISDAVSAVEILYPVIQESARGSETVSTLGVFVSVASDSASAQDTMTVAASIFNAALSESVTGADSQVGLITFPTSVAESVQGSDTDVGFIVFPASISEGATGIDQFSAVLTLNPQVSESAQGSDVVIVAASIFNVPVSEGAVAQDVAAAGITVYSSITEALRGNAVINARFLWEPVDDNQTPNWGDITPVQAAGWTEVDDSQSTGWSVVDDSQTTSWVEVDDGQTAGWVTVNTTP